MSNKISKQLGDLIAWTNSPHPIDKITELLSGLNESDLLFAVKELPSSPAGRICWAELGRRKNFIDFEVRVSVAEGRLNLTFEGDAKPIHTAPVLQHHTEKKS